MTIAGMKEGSKAALGRIPADYLIILIILLTASATFALGILAGREMGTGGEGDRLWVEDLGEKASVLPAATVAAPAPKAVEPAPAIPVQKNYVASKNGARYYLPECGGVKRIKEENKVWFATKEIAEAEGYTPAVNCPGL